MANAILITSISGIVVSGVVGPSATAWSTRRTARKQFVRDQGAKGRDDLRTLFDEAASVLGLGPIRLRQIWEAGDAGMTDALRAWPDEVYVIGQRLQLRLGAGDTVVTEYDKVRTALTRAGEVAPNDNERHDQAVKQFEDARDKFLAAALAKLKEPIPDKEPS